MFLAVYFFPNYGIPFILHKHKLLLLIHYLTEFEQKRRKSWGTFYFFVTPDDDPARVADAVAALADALRRASVRVRTDDRDHVRPGAKYFEWERAGVPLRVEIGPRDVDDDSCVFAYRVGDDDKITVSLDNAAAEAVAGLERTQFYLYDAAKERLE